jgi:hypothetical protein
LIPLHGGGGGGGSGGGGSGGGPGNGGDGNDGDGQFTPRSLKKSVSFVRSSSSFLASN